MIQSKRLDCLKLRGTRYLAIPEAGHKLPHPHQLNGVFIMKLANGELWLLPEMHVDVNGYPPAQILGDHYELKRDPTRAQSLIPQDSGFVILQGRKKCPGDKYALDEVIFIGQLPEMPSRDDEDTTPGSHRTLSYDEADQEAIRLMVERLCTSGPIPDMIEERTVAHRHLVAR